MGNGAFQTLIVAGLFLLIAAVIFLAVLVIRRGRGGAAVVSDYSRATLASRPESGTALDTAGQTAGPDKAADSPGINLEAAEALQRKAEMLMASAQTARSEAEEDTRQRRAELHDQRIGVERREQRLAEREERLDAEIHALWLYLRSVPARPFGNK